jgi:hypothetical protein
LEDTVGDAQSAAPVDPQQAVQGPALAFMIVGGVDLLLQVVGILWLAFVLATQHVPSEAYPQLIGQMIGSMIGIAVSAFLIYAGMQTKQLKNYNLAFAAAVLCCIPCFVCCLWGLPVGIWSILTLNKPEVKAAFTAA